MQTFEFKVISSLRLFTSMTAGITILVLLVSLIPTYRSSKGSRGIFGLLMFYPMYKFVSAFTVQDVQVTVTDDVLHIEKVRKPFFIRGKHRSIPLADIDFCWERVLGNLRLCIIRLKNEKRIIIERHNMFVDHMDHFEAFYRFMRNDGYR